MYNSLTPVILNRKFNTSEHFDIITDPLTNQNIDDVPSYENIKTSSEAIIYSLDRIFYLYNNNELKSNRDYHRSVFNKRTPENYNFVNLNFMNSFNILFGTKLKLHGVKSLEGNNTEDVTAEYYYDPT